MPPMMLATSSSGLSVRNELALDLPRRIGRPVIEAGEMAAARRIGVLHAQRVTIAALDDRRVPLSSSKPITLGPPASASVFNVVAGLQRLAIQRRARRLVRHEPHRLAADVDHAQVPRPHRQVDAVAASAADVMGARIDPMQPDQARPAIGLEQVVRGACRARPFPLRRTRGAAASTAWCRLPRLRRVGRRAQHAAVQAATRIATRPSASSQRPRRNHLSISPRRNARQVGRP